jgi:CheY-like chemotaxis protein
MQQTQNRLDLEKRDRCQEGTVMTKRILVVDDEDTIREVLGVCLRKLGGWQVLTAASGPEALAIAQTDRPDAILLDLRMPAMDGATVLRKLRENPSTVAIPVVMLTANAYLPNLPLFSELGVVATMSKPFEPLILVSQIATILNWPSRL